MLQLHETRVEYDDKPAVIDLSHVVAPEVDEWLPRQVAGIAIRVTEIGTKLGWDAKVRGNFIYVDEEDRLITPTSEIGDLLVVWAGPAKRDMRNEQRLTSESTVRFGVQSYPFEHRLDDFNNNVNVWTYGAGATMMPGLVDFLKVGYKNNRLAVQVLHEELSARVAIHKLDQAVQVLTPKPVFLNWETDELLPEDDMDIANRRIKFLEDEVKRLHGIIDAHDADSSDADTEA